jgi:hypothetical protein
MVVCSAQWHSFFGFRLFSLYKFHQLKFQKKSSVLQNVTIQMVVPNIAWIYICDHVHQRQKKESPVRDLRNLLSSCILDGYAWNIYRHSSAC